MTDNEEPQATQIVNQQIASEGHKLPEQSRIPECSIPRPFTFEHLIHQWQPMGIRVTLNLPFTGNDQDYLFAIRNGPFIPRLFYQYKDSSAYSTPIKGTEIPDPAGRTFQKLDTFESYAFNNMRNVIHAGDNFVKVEPDQSAVVITNYDQPPILASLATMFRKWRGTMHYRIRTIAGFTTQGYIFTSLVRNAPAIIGLYPTQQYTPGISREDRSYRESMINSYVMGDTAMFRHFEVQVPFEYPVDFYDQFNWIGNRSRPANNFMYTDTLAKDGFTGMTRIRNIRNEPHGDNYLLVGLRGKLESSVQNSQITFEIEYRAGDDFQFSDPFLPYNMQYLIPQATYSKLPVSIISVPSKDYYSDGLHGFTANSTPPVNFSRQRNPRPNPPPVTPVAAAPVIDNRSAPRTGGRVPRDIHEGHDEVDDLASEAGDTPDLLEFKRNMRKSLREI
nr:hypothetical protein [Nelson Picorna-like virus 8]